MTNENGRWHPIMPTPDLVTKWKGDSFGYHAAACWGADQELEACCEWFQEFYKTESWVKHDLKHFRAARRPKPPSLKEQALEQLDQISTCFRISHGGPIVCDKILRALEALPND